MSKQNEILATIEEFLKDRKGPDFQVSLESDLSILRMNTKLRFRTRLLMNLTQ